MTATFAVLAIAVGAAAPAGAAPVVKTLGSTIPITDIDVTSTWTVQGLKPSSDNSNVNEIAGKLYEATVTVTAAHGAVTPAIPFLNARTKDGDNYRVLYYAFTPQGLSGATLPEGGQSTGKVYFDVTGPAPTIVAYNDVVGDRAVWE
jgi:hypothetical protein